ncbi:MAG: sensor histidine kinase, partial [Actinomycetes bacterium]
PGLAPVARTLLGVGLVGVGAAVFLATEGQLSAARDGLLATAVVVAGLALVTGPFWLRTVRELGDERRARIREQERAEIAAHVHDSVLHTLALIQRHVDDPREVQRLARSQERTLRTWLYRPEAAEEGTLVAGVERIAGEVEEAHGAPLDVVVVGDCPLDAPVNAMLAAAREAMVNAAKYAGEATVSVYAEVEPGQVTLYVRDRGPGFDLDDVPPDRLGIRESVVGRMRRNGGRAHVRSTPGEGTEVELTMLLTSQEGAR